ncbi:MAG TPA: type IV pilus biogenesis/stability protein PilW [Janthinobacterium sp.]|nr:type IV pilus biogenesis/stability protein PilW [Janthinobacterium sp.]
MRALAQRCSLALAACGLAALLSACASGPGRSGQSELTTSSDQTSAQKRAGIRMQLAVGYYEQGQQEVALDEIKLALQADPDFADAYGMRALIYVAMGQTALAEDNFQRALKLAPNHPDLSNNYGSFLCENGHPAQAIAYFEVALKNKTYQSPGKALNNAGACSLKMKDYASAESYLLRALQTMPDVPATNANLARVYYQRRDYERAGFFIGRLMKITTMESLTADVLWLAIKVQHKLGDVGAEAGLATQLRRHHSASPEYAAYQRGAFDE